MESKAKIKEIIEQNGNVTSRELVQKVGVSRQYINQIIVGLIKEGKIVKIGGTRNAFYVSYEYLKIHQEILPHTVQKKYKNESLEEHKVLAELEEKLPSIKKLPENVRSIFTFAFSEMLNNAIEHSESKKIDVEISIDNDELSFVIQDAGIGVFRNIMKKKNLASEMEAIQDLLKGKTTTMPKSHSGEGIFFTSKAGDTFSLMSYGQQLIITNANTDDIMIHQLPVSKRGTRVSFAISTQSKKHLTEVFRKYTNLTEESDYGFDKTEIRIRLFTNGGVYISRSQARRVLTGLEKFTIVLFDYTNVPMVGQAFVDEIYRVFHNLHPNIVLENEHMNEGVRFMVERAKNEAQRNQKGAKKH